MNQEFSKIKALPNPPKGDNIWLKAEPDGSLRFYVFTSSGWKPVGGGSSGGSSGGGSDAGANVEVISNKVQSISAESTDVQYPSAKLLYDQLNGYTDLVPVTGREITGDEAHFLGIKNSERDSVIAIENPAGSGEKKIIIKYPVEDGRFDNTDRAVFWLSERFTIIGNGNAPDDWEFVLPVSHNSNDLNLESQALLFIPLNDNGKAELSEEFGSISDHVEIVIPDNSIFVFHTGMVHSIDPTDGNTEEVQDSGSVVVFTEETLSPVARKSYFDGYTEHKQLPVREMTAKEKEAWMSGETEEEIAAYGYNTFMAYTNPAGSGEKTIQVKISTESGHYIDSGDCGLVYADSLTWVDLDWYKSGSLSDGILEMEVVLPENTTILLGPRCFATEWDFDNGDPILDATFDIEITEEIEHGRVLREEDVTTTKEAKLLGFIKNNATLKSYMRLLSVLEGETKTWFEEYAAYMQNYGPMSVYPEFKTTAEAIDEQLVSEDTVSAEQYFESFIHGFDMFHEDGYPAEFLHFPSLVCIGKTGDQERWVCAQLFATKGSYLAVYDAKPKLTQVAASGNSDAK